MNRFLKLLGGVLFAATLAACGGGGGSAGTTGGSGGSGGTGSGGGSTGGTNTPTLVVSDFALFTDKSAIANTGADSAKLTVIAVDSNRNVVSGASVTVSTDQNSVYVPQATTTDASGAVTGQIQIGGDKADRDITVTVTVNGIVKRTTVHVGGSKITLAVSPSAPTPGQTVTLTVTVVDSGGNPISAKTVTLAGTVAALQNQVITTNTSGVASLAFAAPSTSGVYTISATGSGTIAPDYQLTVFASGAGVPTAVIPAGVVPSLSAAPNVLSVNSTGSTANKSVLRFLLLDGANQPVQNVRVRFDDLTSGLPRVGASIASGTSTLYTDASGTVSTQYIAGQNNSPTNGVKLRACYKATDFTDTSDCPAEVDASLTVAGQALAVSIGDDNQLQSTSGTYIKNFAVTVADSAGRAVANAPIDISVDLTHYGKGIFGNSYSSPGSTTATATVSSVPLSLTAASQSMSFDPAANNQRVWCPNEDYNRNGNVDPTSVFGGTSENYNGSVDSNGQPTLEPRKSDLLVSFADPNVTTTDASGLVLIKVQYSQRFADWLAYKLRVTANVSGSQGMSERLFVTQYLDGDLVNGSFHQPPYGTRSCLSPN